MGVCGNVCCVAAIVEYGRVFEPWSVCDGDAMYVVFSVCIVRRGDRCSCMGSVSVSSCKCCMIVSSVLNVAFCMTCSLLMLVEDTRGDHMEEEYSRVCHMTAF